MSHTMSSFVLRQRYPVRAPKVSARGGDESLVKEIRRGKPGYCYDTASKKRVSCEAKKDKKPSKKKPAIKKPAVKKPAKRTKKPPTPKPHNPVVFQHASRYAELNSQLDKVATRSGYMRLSQEIAQLRKKVYEKR